MVDLYHNVDARFATGSSKSTYHMIAHSISNMHCTCAQSAWRACAPKEIYSYPQTWGQILSICILLYLKYLFKVVVFLNFNHVFEIQY